MIARPTRAFGRCSSCGHHLDPIRIRDEFGHVTGDTPDGRCVNPRCVLAYARQPYARRWWKGRDWEREVRAAVVALAGTEA